MQKITIIDPNHEKKHGILNSIFTKITLKCHKIDHFQHFHQPKKNQSRIVGFQVPHLQLHQLRLQCRNCGRNSSRNTCAQDWGEGFAGISVVLLMIYIWVNYNT